MDCVTMIIINVIEKHHKFWWWFQTDWLFFSSNVHRSSLLCHVPSSPRKSFFQVEHDSISYYYCRDVDCILPSEERTCYLWSPEYVLKIVGGLSSANSSIWLWGNRRLKMLLMLYHRGKEVLNSWNNERLTSCSYVILLLAFIKRTRDGRTCRTTGVVERKEMLNEERENVISCNEFIHSWKIPTLTLSLSLSIRAYCWCPTMWIFQWIILRITTAHLPTILTQEWMEWND